jgi:hypothetical protein
VIDPSLNEGERQDHGDRARTIAERGERARDLYLRARQRVVRLNADTFTVPGSSRQSYRVRYGGTVESCSCVDFEVNAGRIPCKHVQLRGIMFAVRRAAEIPVAGDPFAYAGDCRLHELEDRLRHEDLDVEERAELADLVARLRRRGAPFRERRIART